MINGISRSEQNIRVQNASKFVFFFHHFRFFFNLNYIRLAVWCFFWCFTFFVFNSDLCVFFLLACKEGYFGTNCSQKCSPNCKSDTCRHTDGWCICDARLKGGNCTKGKFGGIFIFLFFFFYIFKNTQFRTSAFNTLSFK